MQLEGDALEKACEHWLMYVETYDEIDEIFTKYNVSHTDQLSVSELGTVSQQACAHCTQQQYGESSGMASGFESKCRSYDPWSGVWGLAKGLSGGEGGRREW